MINKSRDRVGTSYLIVTDLIVEIVLLDQGIKLDNVCVLGGEGAQRTG